MSRFPPPELQGQILQQAAQAQSKAETLDLMLVSHMAYDRVSYIAFRIIIITCFEVAKKFLLFFERKGTTFWASRLRGLCVRITYNSDPDALPTSPLWTKLFSDVIPHLTNLQYFEGLGSPGGGAQRLAIGHVLVTSVSTLPNLTYFAANNDVLPDISTQDLPLFHSVTHLKRFNVHTVTLHILRFLRSFPSLTHFLTTISTLDLAKISSLAEKLSHLKVLALARSLDSLPPTVLALLATYPNLVFRERRDLFHKNDIQTFKEIAGNGSHDVWTLCEEEIRERSGKVKIHASSMSPKLRPFEPNILCLSSAYVNATAFIRTFMSLDSRPQFPPELQERILQLAAHVSSGEERNRLMLVSQLAYDRVSYIAYRTIGITNCQSFYQIFTSVERKGVSFFASRLRGLHIWVPGSAAGMFWSTLFTAIIPELFHLNYLQVFGDVGYGPEAAAVREALHVALRALPSLNYFVINNSLLKSDYDNDVPLSQSVTHFKRLESITPVQSTLRLLKAFPNLTHFMAPILNSDSLNEFIVSAKHLSYLKVIILGCYRTFDSEVLSPLLRRFPNLVFRNIHELYKSFNVLTSRGSTEAEDKNIWRLGEEELLQRRQGVSNP